MTTVKVRGDIDADGTLRLAVPVGLPAGPAEVLVVVQPDAGVKAGTIEPERAPPLRSARSGLFIGDPIILSADVDAILREMNDASEAKLSNLP